MPPPPPDDSGWASQPPSPPGPPSHSPGTTKGWTTLSTGEGVELAGAGARIGARIIDFLIVGVLAIVLFVAGFFSLLNIDFAYTEYPNCDLFEQLFGSEYECNSTKELTQGAWVFLVMSVAIAVGLYDVWLVAARGQTVGKMATRIRVVRADNGLVPGWGRSLGRWLVPAAFGILGYFLFFIGLVGLLVYASILWDRDRQGWHDKAAGTLVINA